MTSTVAPDSGTTVAAAAGPGYAERRADHLARLRKVEGQVRGIARMVDEDRYCIDVLTQVSAATRALQQVALGLLDDHLRRCVIDAARAGSAERDATFDELAEYFGAADAEDEGGAFKGWAYVAWAKPEGATLEAIAERLKALKLTIRNAPLDQKPVEGKCLFTGDAAREYVLIGRAY